MASVVPPATDQVHLLQINSADNVAVAVVPLSAGYQGAVNGVSVTIRQAVDLGAKVAIHPIARGEKVIKFGEPIGSASTAIRAGDYVHTHNLHSDYIPNAIGSDTLTGDPPSDVSAN